MSSDGDSMLLKAIKQNHIVMIKSLVSGGADVNQPNQEGVTRSPKHNQT